MLLWPEFLCLPPLISLTIAGSVDIEAVTNQTFAEYSGKPLSTYSIQEALYNDPYEEDLSLTSNLYLFTDACKQADGTSNCTTACSDNATIFENLETWHNCMHYPTIAFQYANNSLSDNAVRTVQGLGIIGHKTNSSTAATTDAIRTCLVDYCSSNAKGCEAEFQRVSTSYDEGYQIPTPYFNSTYWDFERDGYQLIEYICDFSSYPVNPDIGGIGVFPWS